MLSPASTYLPHVQITTDKFIMLLLPFELVNILADNAESRNTRSAGKTCLQRNRHKKTDMMVKDTAQIMPSPPFKKYTMKRAQLGGYMGNKNKLSLANIVIWQGLKRLNSIETG